METSYFIIGALLIIMNVMGYISMWADKKRARKNKYRISEKTLFTIALLGGSLGSILGMKTYRHKTKHWYFKYGMPLILMIQILFICWLITFLS